MSSSVEVTASPLIAPAFSELALALLKIPVADVSISSAFYHAVLGANVQFVVPEYGWAQLQLGGEDRALPFALYVPGKGGGDRTPGGSVDFHLCTSNLEALCRQSNMSDHTGSITEVLTGNDGTRFMEITDPDGNVLKVVEQA